LEGEARGGGKKGKIAIEKGLGDSKAASAQLSMVTETNNNEEGAVFLLFLTSDT